jgi:hypothetical protein
MMTDSVTILQTNDSAKMDIAFVLFKTNSMVRFFVLEDSGTDGCIALRTVVATFVGSLFANF